jgi:hypothetical protein
MSKSITITFKATDTQHAIDLTGLPDQVDLAAAKAVIEPSLNVPSSPFMYGFAITKTEVTNDTVTIEFSFCEDDGRSGYQYKYKNVYRVSGNTLKEESSEEIFRFGGGC